jgi:hypothetical protein
MCSLQKKLKLPNKQILILAVLFGVLFASCCLEYRDSKFKCYSSFLACQFSSALGGYYLHVFLNTKATNFWIGTTVALFGMAMLVGFKFFLN